MGNALPVPEEGEAGWVGVACVGVGEGVIVGCSVGVGSSTGTTLFSTTTGGGTKGTGVGFTGMVTLS